MTRAARRTVTNSSSRRARGSAPIALARRTARGSPLPSSNASPSASLKVQRGGRNRSRDPCRDLTRSRASPTTQFTRTSPSRIWGFPCAPSSMAARPAPPPTRRTTNRCAAWSPPRHSLARNQPRNPGLAADARPAEISKGRALFAATAAATPQGSRPRGRTRLPHGREEPNKPRPEFFRAASTQSVLANSRGFLRATSRRAPNSRSPFSKRILPAGPKRIHPTLAEIDPDALAESASRKAAGSRKPRELAPGQYTAILEPSAVLDLVGFLFYDFAGTAVLDKRSCLTGRIGKKIFGENITLVGRRVPSAATRRALRRRGRSAAKSPAGGSRRAEESGLLARDRKKNESKAHRPRLLAAERIWRSADESRFRGRRDSRWRK